MSLKNAISCLFIMLMLGCSKKRDSDVSPDQGNPPAKSVLSFPAKDAVCTTGTVISDTQTSIIFSWAASASTDNYELNLKNLLTGQTTSQTTNTTNVTVTLLRNTPYSWYIVSKSNSNTNIATSDIFKFYVAGLGVTNYNPFSATIVSPAYGQVFTTTAKTTNLSWTGSDVDNDIVSYDVYFGTNPTPPLFKSNITDQFLNGVTVAAHATYYWKVITTDSKGNTSDSAIYQFTVN